jgi:DNA mismatch endonuclease (patch repair protein)
MDILTPAARSARMALIRSKDSRFELRIRSTLHRLGYRYRKHHPSLPGKPDLVFPSRGKIIFLNGCYWHGHTCRLARLPKSNIGYWSTKIAANAARDRKHGARLRRKGWKVLTVWECQMKNFDSTLRRIENFLRV